MKRNYWLIAVLGIYGSISVGAFGAEPGKAAKDIPATPADQNPQVHGTRVPADSAAAILGKWTNKDYNGQGRSGRVVYSKASDGKLRYIATDMADGSGKMYSGVVVFHKQWTDPDGRRHAISTVTLDEGFAWKTLSRISQDGKILEVQSGVAEIDPQGPRYSIYFKSISQAD